MEDSKNIFVEKHNLDQISYYDRTNKKTMIPNCSKYVVDQINQFIEVSKIQSSDKILEIGCGMGKYTFPLLERGYQITGIDLSPYLLDQLRSYNDGRFSISLFNCDILETPRHVDEKFDFIIGFMVLHHLHQIPLSFEVMHKLLKPGGRLVFLEPNAWNLLYYLQIAFTPGMKWKSEKGIVNMRQQVIKKSAKTAGFNNLEIHHFGFFPPFIKNTTRGNNLEKAISKIRFIDPIRPFQIFVISE